MAQKVKTNTLCKQAWPCRSTKIPILKEVNFGKMQSVKLNTFTTYLSSLLGVIAEYNSNHAQK